MAKSPNLLDIKLYPKYSLTLLTSSFIISSATIIKNSSEEREFITSSTDLDIIKQATEENIKDIYFRNLHSVKVITVFESEDDKYRLICGNKLNYKKINNDTVKILTIALKQIVAAYEKQKQDELLKQKNKDLMAAEKLAVLGSLVAGLAHELNTPLGMIITSNSHIAYELSKMKNEFDNNTLKRSLMENVLTTTLEGSKLVDLNVKRLNELISSFKQLSIDRALLDKSSFKLKEYINKVLLILSPILKQKKTKIDIICDENIEVLTFPGLLSQIITNLVQNSLIHAFDKPEDGIITIESYIKNNKLVFNYHDNGKGMSPEVTKHIFDPFFTTRRNKGGTGLGMHIVHNIVTQNFQGTIICFTKKGKGSRFYLELPL